MRSYHDMGGVPAGAINREEKELLLWEKRVEAMLAILTKKGLLTTDESRRGLESLGADVYLNSTYAERRIASAANNLLMKGMFTVEELAAKLAEVDRRPEQLP